MVTGRVVVAGVVSSYAEQLQEGSSSQLSCHQFNKEFMHTLVEFLPITPARSYMPIKYHLRLIPLCCPDIPLNAMTSECSFQVVDEESDLIQWAVTLMKDTFVWSTDQRLVIVEMHSLSLDCIMVRHENRT